jgi:hypothetical protein
MRIHIFFIAQSFVLEENALCSSITRFIFRLDAIICYYIEDRVYAWSHDYNFVTF